MTTKASSFLLLCWSILCGSLYANPLPAPPPIFWISELMFDADDQWIMEIENTAWDLYMIDSVDIHSSNGKAKLSGINFGSFDNIQSWMVLRNENLDTALPIQPTGDSIVVTTYYKNQQYWKDQPLDSINISLVFGNYPEATVRNPNENESIVDLTDDGYGNIKNPIYSINKTPTIEEPNDNINGTYQTVGFQFLYPDGQPFAAPGAYLWDEKHDVYIDLIRQENGWYVGNVHYRAYLFKELHFKSNYWPNVQYDHWTLKAPIYFDPEWDLRNLEYITSHLDQFLNTPTVRPEESVLKIYPNPVKEKTFDFETKLPVRSAECYLKLTGLNGQKAMHYPIHDNKGKIMLPADIPSGIYTISLVMNDKNQATEKIVVQ